MARAEPRPPCRVQGYDSSTGGRGSARAASAQRRQGLGARCYIGLKTLRGHPFVRNRTHARNRNPHWLLRQAQQGLSIKRGSQGEVARFGWTLGQPSFALSHRACGRFHQAGKAARRRHDLGRGDRRNGQHLSRTFRTAESHRTRWTQPSVIIALAAPRLRRRYSSIVVKPFSGRQYGKGLTVLAVGLKIGHSERPS